jgi:hypothetical protein
MKHLLPYSMLIAIISCTNTNKPDSNAKVSLVKTEESGYSKEDTQFMRKADSICQVIDVDNLIERTKDKMIIDRDGQEYASYVKGYAKNHPDSVNKLLARIIFSDQKSATTTFYYYNGTVIKSLFEILADDTVHISFYYNGDKMIYPNELGMEKEAKEIFNKSISWKKDFLSNK